MPGSKHSPSYFCTARVEGIASIETQTPLNQVDFVSNFRLN